MQPAQQAIEILQAGRHAGHRALAAHRRFRHVDGFDNRLTKGRQAAFDLARFGQVIEALFGAFDLAMGIVVQVVLEGVVDHILAQGDELAPEIKVVDGAAVVLGVDDGHEARLQLGQVLRPADIAQQLLALEEVLELNGVGDLATLD